MSVKIRPLRDAGEVNTAFGTFLRAMVGLPFRELDATTITEQGRYLGAIDDGAVVGGVDSYSSTLVVPGGARVRHAAVTHIGVLPTHRRRGIVRALVERQLADIARTGEIVATLRASEAVIYERFGYGIASAARGVRVDTRRALLRDTVPLGGRIELLDRAVTDDILIDIYRRVSRVGVIDRPAGWWRLQRLRREADPVTSYVAVHSTIGPGGETHNDGYVIYQPADTDTWFTSREKTVRVADFIAADDNARAGLWRHLLTLDLVDVVAFDALALDDPLPLAVTDERSVELGPAHDETWLRLVDVRAALAARTYRGGDEVAIRVRDAQIDSNNATFVVGPDGAEPSERTPEVTVDVATLAAAYLGGTRWAHLAAAGRVEIHSHDAPARLDGLFATSELPFSGTVF